MVFPHTGDFYVRLTSFEILTHSLLDMTSWGSYSDLHVDRSMAVIQAALTGSPRSSSTCLIHVRRGRSGVHLQCDAGRIPCTRSVNAGHFGWESTDVAEQWMTTVGYYEWQMIETSRLTDCSVLDLVQPLDAAQYSPLWCHMKGLDFWDTVVQMSPIILGATRKFAVFRLPLQRRLIMDFMFGRLTTLMEALHPSNFG